MVGREVLKDTSEINGLLQGEGATDEIERKREFRFIPPPLYQAKEVIAASAVPAITDRDAIRFRNKVSKRGPADCWPWKGGAGTSGHGRFRIAGRLHSSHRIAYAIANGGLVDGGGYHGTVVRHSCDNPRCCNPAHLVAGTQADNVQDMIEKGRAYWQA